MKKPKVSRNDPCPCGSGKKYKNCCLLKSKGNTSSLSTASIDKEINNAGILSLKHDVEAITDAIQKLAKDKAVYARKITGTWHTEGDPLSHLRTAIEFALKDNKIGSELGDYLIEMGKKLVASKKKDAQE